MYAETALEVICLVSIHVYNHYVSFMTVHALQNAFTKFSTHIYKNFVLQNVNPLKITTHSASQLFSIMLYQKNALRIMIATEADIYVSPDWFVEVLRYSTLLHVKIIIQL